MSEKNIIKYYKPAGIKSPWLSFVFIISIFGGFYIIFKGYRVFSLSKFIAVSILMIAGIYACLKFLFLTYVNCVYVETTDVKISGMNKFKLNRGNLIFNEIKDIWITKGVFSIILKDIKDKKLRLTFHPEFIPLLKEILEKADNLEKIDINYDYFVKINAFSDISQIKPVFDRRLIKIRNKIKSV